MLSESLVGRKGRVLVNLDFFNEYLGGQSNTSWHPYDELIIVRAEVLHAKNEIEYFAYHPSFEVVKLGEKIPTYEAYINLDDGKYVGYFAKVPDHGA